MLPVVIGSAIKAIEGDQGEVGVPSIYEIVRGGGRLYPDAGAGDR